eukprot:scaffold13881_cov124-Isochrysis_galbana.AAC.4
MASYMPRAVPSPSNAKIAGPNHAPKPPIRTKVGCRRTPAWQMGAVPANCSAKSAHSMLFIVALGGPAEQSSASDAKLASRTRTYT